MTWIARESQLRAKIVATDDPKTFTSFDPNIRIEMQRRNLEAFMNAGQIMANGIHTI